MMHACMTPGWVGGWVLGHQGTSTCLGTKGWVLGNPKKHGAVNAIATLDLPRPDCRAVVVGRDDGQLQVRRRWAGPRRAARC